jgi:hypothetical protein
VTVRGVIAVCVALLIGALGYRTLFAGRDGAREDPLLVLVSQMRTRAIVEHERDITVWYRTCPEVPGVNPQVLVIWPGKLSYELDLAQTRLELRGDVLYAAAPAIRADEPAVPTELGEYVASSSIWTLPSDQQLVLDEMKKASPLARHLSHWYLKNDPTITQRLREELAIWLQGIAGALRVPVSRVEVEVAPSTVAIPARPTLSLCEGGTGLANGTPFVRRETDGSEAGIFPARR